jgi:hypothetical protein
MVPKDLLLALPLPDYGVFKNTTFVALNLKLKR